MVMKRAQWLVGICVLLCATHCGDDSDKSGGSSSQSPGGSAAPAAGASAGATPSAAAGAGGSAAGKGGTGTASSAGTGANAGSVAANDDAGMPGGNTASPSGRLADGTNPNAVNPYPNYKSEIYAQDKMWMCKPGLAKNYCLEDIADATEALPDGTFKPFMDNLGAEHPFD